MSDVDLEAPVPRYVLRALAYLDMLSGTDVSLTVPELDLFAATAPPRPHRRVNALAWPMAQFEAQAARPIKGQPVTSYCQDMGWVQVVNGRVLLTVRGVAVLQASRVRDSAAESRQDPRDVVLLDPGSPWSDFKRREHYLAAGKGMLVDPYFQPSMLPWIVENTDLTKILTGESHVKGMGVALHAARQAGSEVEIRTLPRKQLHDRAIVYEDNTVMAVGSSANTKALSVMVRLTPTVASEYVKALQALWDAATPVVPSSPPD